MGSAGRDLVHALVPAGGVLALLLGACSSRAVDPPAAGCAWRSMGPSTHDSLYEVSGVRGELFVVGAGGAVRRHDGLSWTDMPSLGEKPLLTDVSIVSANDIYGVVGSDRDNVLHYDGNRWSVVASVHAAGFRGIWANAQGAFAVGTYGAGIVFDGRTWRRRDIGLPIQVFGLWARALDDLYLTGDRQTIARYDGTAWRDLGCSECPETLGTITGTPTHLFVTRYTLTDAVWAFDGTVWNKLALGALGPRRINALWADLDGTLFAVGDAGFAASFDGSGWRRHETPVTADLLGLWGRSKEHVVAVGREGTVLLYSCL